MDNKEVYSFDSSRGLLVSEFLELPPTQITQSGITVGGGNFVGNVVVGLPVGLKISKDGVAMGASLPEGLARLKVPD